MTTATATRTATVTGSAGHLAEQIGWASSHLSTRPVFPVLTGMRLTATPGEGAVARATDYDTWVQADLDIDTDGAVDVVLPGRLLARLLATLPRHLMVSLAVDPDQVRITCGAARASLRTLPLEDYPKDKSWPEPVGSMSPQDLLQAVSRIVDAASTSENLPMLQGVHITLAEQGAQLEATDRYRFAISCAPWMPTLEGDDTTHTALVPARTLHQAVKTLDKGDTVGIGLSTDMVALIGDGRRLLTRRMDGEFPTWEKTQRLIPDLDTEVTVTTADLLTTLKRVSLFAERYTPLRISISGEGLVVRAGSGETAAAAEDVDADVETDHDLVVHVMQDYLIEALSAIPGERARFSIGPAEKPFLIRPGDEEETGLTWLLMPTRQPNGGER